MYIYIYIRNFSIDAASFVANNIYWDIRITFHTLNPQQIELKRAVYINITICWTIFNSQNNFSIAA